MLFGWASRKVELEYELASTDDVRAELTRWKRSFWILSAIYALTLVVVIGELFLLRNIINKGIMEGFLESKTFFPDVPREKVTFQPNQTYMDEYPGSLRAPTIWDSLIPAGAGFVDVPNPSSFGISGGFPVSNGTDITWTESYGVSMFHQLHCLAMIKSGFGPRDHGDHQHFAHCFDYLRQAIMCAGDTTLEKAAVRDGERKPEVNGWGVEHECRSFNTIFDFTYENRAGDKTGIS